MPIRAVVSPGRSSTSLVAAIRSVDRASAHACTAMQGVHDTRMITSCPPQPCHRASRWVPTPRSSQGDRDIKINMMAAPYPAAIPLDVGNEGGCALARHSGAQHDLKDC